MKIGNLSQTVLKRSVLKQLRSNREEVFIMPSVEEMCSGHTLEGKDAVIVSSTVVFGDEKDLGCYGIAKAINHVTSRGADPIGVEVVIQLPPYAYESRLKSMVAYMEACCQKHVVQIMGMKASVNPVIHSAMVYVTATGSVNKDQVIQSCMAQPEEDIVLLQSVGTEGALRILNKKEKEINERFISSFFNPLKECKEKLLTIDALKEAISYGAVAVHPIGEGGILAALWELGEAAGLGLDLDLKKMSIRQDVIEICEFVGVNPYQLSATGSALIVVEDGSLLIEKLKELGYEAAVIGRTTRQKERVIWNGGEKRFLDRPSQDELLKLYED